MNKKYLRRTNEDKNTCVCILLIFYVPYLLITSFIRNKFRKFRKFRNSFVYLTRR